MNLTEFKRVAYLSMNPKTELISLGQVDGSLITHLILAFAHIDANGNLVLSHQDDSIYLGGIKEFKRLYPCVKIMISVSNNVPEEPARLLPGQQANLNSASVPIGGFAPLANSTKLRQQFARSAIEFLVRYSLDGIDLDWEFPNFPNTFVNKENERTGLTKILMEVRAAIVENFYNRQVTEQYRQTLNPYALPDNVNFDQHQQTVEPYLLTVAIGAQEAILRSSYELKHLGNLCDWFNVMSYDYYLFKPYAPFTGPNSPLNPVMDPFVPVFGKLSFVSTMNRLLAEDIEREKIVMGIPTYARAYRLLFRNTHPARFTLTYATKGGQLPDYLNYREIRDILAKPDTIVDFDERARVPYLLTDDGYTWISYEDERSVVEKLNCIIENRLAGFMTWNLNSDDFGSLTQLPKLNGAKADDFPLHRALMKGVESWGRKKVSNHSENLNYSNNSNSNSGQKDMMLSLN